MRSPTPPTLACTPYKSQRLEEKYREDTRHEIQDDSAGEGKHHRENKPRFVSALGVGER
jgi:hypothetical protein